MDTDQKIEQLRRDLDELIEEFYRNNFTTHQETNKTAYFNVRLKVPHYDTLPSTCVVGEIAESAGKLRVCSSANTWAIVGTQS